MKITCTIDSLEDPICCEEVADTYDSGLLQEKEINLQGNAIDKLKGTQLSSGGFFILDMQLLFGQPQRMFLEVEGESVLLHFLLNGDLQTDIQGLSYQHAGHRHNVCYAPVLKGAFNIQAGGHLHCFAMLFSKEFYFRLLDQHCPLHSLFARNIINGKPSYLSPTPLQITAEIKWVINDIRHCQRKGALKRLFIEARLTELLMLQLEQWQNQRAQKPATGILRGDDREKLQEAKAILEKSFQNPPTIQELARQVYLNEYKLKQGFKAYFHHTVHGYVVWLRMEQAKQLLKQQQHAIFEIAYQIGYKNAAHFTAAFKKHFGFLPSQSKGNFGE